MTHNTIQNLTERNKELLNKIEELEKSKVEVKKYEYSLKRSLIKRTPEEHLIRENEIMGKIFLEILLKYSAKRHTSEKLKTDADVDELLNQPDWREKTQFEVGDYQYKEENEVSEEVGHLWAKPWLISAREPIEIIENLKEEQELYKKASVNVISKKVGIIEDKKKEINKLKEELEKKEVIIKNLEAELEEADEIIASHEAALEKAKEWRLREEKNLKEKIEEQRDLVFNFTKSLVIKEREFDKLSESYGEEHEKLRKETKKNTAKDEKIKELEWKLYLANKSLPSLPKKPSKLKYLKNKITLKSQQLIEKVKHQSQELLARIEVKTK